MGIVPEVSAAFAAEVLRRDAGAVEWLEDLPDRWQRALARWRLTAVGPARTGSTSLVLPVRTAKGDRLALKLISPAASFESEAAALEASSGHGAVELVDVDFVDRVMLLEWAGGPALSEMADKGAAMSIAGRISAHLAVATPVPGAPRLAEQAVSWLPQLLAQHRVAQHTGTALPADSFEYAAKIIRQLSTDDTTTPTHGDLSLSNILKTDDGRWVAIDPLLLVGTAANEAHTVVRSHLATILTVDDPLLLLNEWTRLFTESAGVDFGLAQAISHARYVASYYWESQNSGDPANVEGLRRITQLTGRSV